MQRRVSRGWTNPSWLESLKEESLAGESPLLGSSECKFVNDVMFTLKREMSTGYDSFPASRSATNRDFHNITDDFTKVTDHLKNSSSLRRHFLPTYEGWRLRRDRTILELKKIADSIDKDKENCEIAKIIGNGVSLLGGGICLLSEKKEEKNVAQMIGSVMLGIGNLTTAGTSALGMILLQENIEAAKKAIAEDMEYLEDLRSCMGDSNGMLHALKNIKSIDADGSLQAVARNLQALSKRNLNEGSRRSEIKMILKSLNCPPDLRGDIADVMGILVSTSMLCERYSPVFAIAAEGSKCLPRLRVAKDLFQSAAGLNTAVSLSRSSGLTRVQRERVFEGMAADATKIARACLEMDTESMESREVRRSAAALEEEAESFERMYYRMKNLRYS